MKITANSNDQDDQADRVGTHRCAPCLRRQAIQQAASGRRARITVGVKVYTGPVLTAALMRDER
jgi:hypothetical protein